MRLRQLESRDESRATLELSHISRVGQVEMLVTILDCFRLASASALRSTKDTVRRVLALAGGTAPQPIRTLLAASAHIFARPEFLRATYPRSGSAVAPGPSKEEEIARQECQMLQVWAVGASMRVHLAITSAFL